MSKISNVAALVMLALSGSAAATGIYQEGTPSELAKIAASTLEYPYIQQEVITPVMAENLVLPGISAENTRQGEITTHFRVIGEESPNLEPLTCDYPKGGVFVLYEAGHPLNYRVTGVSIEASVICKSASWRIETSPDNHSGWTRRWDSAYAWKKYLIEAGQAAIDKTAFLVPMLVAGWFVRRQWKKRKSTV